ncbi:MAG: transposase [Hymenobacter sp.]|nr:MAG: transposase [Hymenobacter sp.]
MKAYSDDLRQRVAAACAVPGRSLPQVAAQFAVSLSFVEKLRRRQRTHNSVAALPHRGGPAPRLTEAGRATLVTCVAAQPDATLDELRHHLVVAGGPEVGRTALWNALQALDWRRKKRVSTLPNATLSA